MTTVSFTPSALIQLETASDFFINMEIGEDERIVQLNLHNDYSADYDINGANGIGRYEWKGISWEELCVWAGLAQGVESGTIVYEPGIGNLWLTYEQNGETEFVFIEQQSGNAQNDGWVDESGNPENGVENGEYPLPTDYDDSTELRPAYWQLNQETNSPMRLDDFSYNESFFLRR